MKKFYVKSSGYYDNSFKTYFDTKAEAEHYAETERARWGGRWDAPKYEVVDTIAELEAEIAEHKAKIERLEKQIAEINAGA